MGPVDILCTCGTWLAEVEVEGDARVLIRLRRCPRCHREMRPSTPLALIQGGKVQVERVRGPVGLGDYVDGLPVGR